MWEKKKYTVKVDNSISRARKKKPFYDYDCFHGNKQHFSDEYKKYLHSSVTKH
jgi:hypothetical protein